MNRIISFILGALIMFVIMFSIDVLKDDSMDTSETTDTNVVVDIVKDKGDITKQIAFINNDIGIGETNVAESLIENMPMSDGYDLVTTTYNNATTGLENDQYVAYIMFDANYSSSLLSVATDELPEKAKITLKINPNLSDQQLTEVNKVLFTDYMYVKDTINYVYIAYLLDIVHNTQDDVSEIIANEDYMNSISESVANYMTEMTNSLEGYLKEPPSTEIELDTSGLQELETKNIEQISTELGIDSESLLASISTAQASFNTSLNQSLPDSNVSSNPLDMDINEIADPNADSIATMINDYLITNLGNLDTSNQLMIQSQSELDIYKSLLERSNVLPSLDELEVDDIVKTILSAPFTDDADGSLSSLEGDFKFEAINDFILSYAMWYSASYDIPLNTCDPAATANCMDDYHAKYEAQIPVWIDKESQLEHLYNQITSDKDDHINVLENLISNLEDGSISSPSDNRVEVKTTNNYISDISDSDSARESMELTTEYCGHSYSNYIAKFACGLLTITNNYSDAIANIDQYNSQVDEQTNTIAEHNSELDSEAEEINSSIDAANTEVNDKLTAHNQATTDNVDGKIDEVNGQIATTESNINESIDSANEQKNTYITNLSKMILDYQTELNENIDSVESSQYDDRQGAYNDATTYLDDYAGMTDGYTTNIDLLTLFASLLPSTRNGNEANYYLYEYLANPLDIVQKTGASDKKEEVDPIESSESNSDASATTEENDNNLIAIILLAIVLIVGLIAYLVLGKEDYED